MAQEAHKPLRPGRAIASEEQTDTDVPLADVWSRTHPKYRIRATVLLAVNVLLFAAVGSFAYWLRSGTWFAPSTAGYWDQLVHTFGGVGRADVSLSTLLLNPINVQDVPMQIPILGLLMAALISIPILVAILYRFWSSLPFIAVVGLLAVMPWLAVTLLASCIIASVRPFQSKFRFVSALAGLAPTVIYFLLAWSGSTEMIVGKIDPVERIKFVAPWVLAIVAASMAFAIVLSIARIVDYRPGAITPLLAIMFGLPVVMFEANIGRDELYYRLLTSRAVNHFTDVDASQPWQQSAMRRWERSPIPKPSWEATKQLESEKWLFELTSGLRPYQSELTRHQAEITHQCDWFREHFPDSRYALNVLFIKARTLDTRVDTAEFRRTKWIRFYDQFPSEASHDTWRLIYENAPDTAMGVVAALRLAQLDARVGQVERAMSRLVRIAKVTRTLGNGKETISSTGGALTQAMSRGAAEESLHISMERVTIETERLYGLLANNRDPIYGYEPISGNPRGDGGANFGLLDLDTRHERYADNLRALKRRYPDCQLEDNIDLELAKLAPTNAARIQQLKALILRFPNLDAIPEAMLRLGIAYRDNGQPVESDETLVRLIRKYPGSVWTAHAARLAPHGAWSKLSRSVQAEFP